MRYNVQYSDELPRATFANRDHQRLLRFLNFHLVKWDIEDYFWKASVSDDGRPRFILWSRPGVNSDSYDIREIIEADNLRPLYYAAMSITRQHRGNRKEINHDA